MWDYRLKIGDKFDSIVAWGYKNLYNIKCQSNFSTSLNLHKKGLKKSKSYKMIPIGLLSKNSINILLNTIKMKRLLTKITQREIHSFLKLQHQDHNEKLSCTTNTSSDTCFPYTRTKTWEFQKSIKICWLSHGTMMTKRLQALNWEEEWIRHFKIFTMFSGLMIKVKGLDL